MKRGTPGHWKILNLAMELKIEPYAAVGICCCMWEWVGASLMSGNIGKADDVMIARQIGWTKKPSVLIDALVKCGLLDRHPEHRLIVHDWSEHAEDGVHTWMVRRRLWFADGKAPRTRHLNSIERKEAEAYYGTATPPPQSKCGENVATPPESRSAKADGTERYGSVRDGSPHSPPKGDGDAKKHPRVIPAYTEAFNDFWNRYPTAGRLNKKGAFKVWCKQHIEREAEPGKPRMLDCVMAGLDKWCQCERWKAGFVCAPTVFLNQARWSNDPPHSERQS